MTLTERTKTFDFSLDTGLEYVSGSITNATYWGESMIPTLNPHIGSQALPYAIASLPAPGQDDGSNFRLSILGGGIATADGNLALKFGYFDLAQTDRFVFAQPPLPSVNPAIAYAPPETLSSGLAGSDDFAPLATQLQLDGLDALAKKGIATFELSTAALPSPPGLSVRAAIGSLIFDHGEGTTYSAQVVHAATSGVDFTTSAAFGAHHWFFYTPQGVLAESTLSGQQQPDRRIERERARDAALEARRDARTRSLVVRRTERRAKRHGGRRRLLPRCAAKGVRSCDRLGERIPNGAELRDDRAALWDRRESVERDVGVARAVARFELPARR